MYKRILLAYDGSVKGRAALREGALLARRLGAEVFLLSVVRANYESVGAGILNLLDAQRQYQQALLGYVRAEGQRYVDTAQRLIALGGAGIDHG